MSIIQLNPPIPMSTPKGDGMAWFMIDPGVEHHLQWVVAIDKTGEIWTYQNPYVRAQKNVTMDRFVPINPFTKEPCKCKACIDIQKSKE